MAVGDPQVVLGLLVRDGDIEYIHIELYLERAPRSCAIFWDLCTASQHDLSLRIIHDGLVIEAALATQTMSDPSPTLDASVHADNTDWKLFETEGLLYMREPADGNEGIIQYIVTTRPRPDLTGKMVVIGKMTSGYSTLRYLTHSLATKHGADGLPVFVFPSGDDPEAGTVVGNLDISIEDFLKATEEDDEYERGRFKRRRPSSMSPFHTTSRSAASPSSKVSKQDAARQSVSPPTGPAQAHQPETSRRIGEHTNDETRRGREGFSPRANTPIQEDNEERAARHQRRRSSPPSRGPKRDVRLEEEEGFRRRGSLPNHRDKIYHDRADNIYGHASGEERRRSKEPDDTASRKT